MEVRLTVRIQNGKQVEPHVQLVSGEYRAYLIKPWGQTLGWYAPGRTEAEAVERLQQRIDAVARRIEAPEEGLGD